VAGVVAARLGEGQAQAFDLLLTAWQLSFLKNKQMFNYLPYN
jgi:hypothetical protein